MGFILGSRVQKTAPMERGDQSANKLRQENSLSPQSNVGLEIHSPFEMRASPDRSALQLLTIPQRRGAEIKLTKEQREQLLSRLPEKAKAEFLREEKLQEIGKYVEKEELNLIRRLPLDDSQLDQALEEVKDSFSSRLSSNTTSSIALGNRLLSLKSFEQHKIEAYSQSELISAMGSLSTNELKNMDPHIQQRIMSRLSENPNAILEIQQRRFYNSEIIPARAMASGAGSNLSKVRQQHSDALMPALLSNHTTGLEQEIAGWSQRLNHASDVTYNARDVLETSKANQRVAQLLQKLSANASPEQQKLMQEQAAEMYTRSSLVLFQNGVPDLDSNVGAGNIRRAGDSFTASAQNWDRGVRTMTTVRNASVVIVAGGVATVAAPAIFAAGVAASGSTAVGFAGSVVGGGIIGSGTGFALGSTTSTIENTGHVLLGNKRSDQAIRDIARQVRSDTYNGGIAGLGSGAAGALGKVLGAGDDVATWILVRNGATSAAAAGATSFSADAAVRITEARADFAKEFDGKGLSEEQLATAYAQHMKRNGLDWKTLSKQGGMNVLVASFFGASGARFEVARQSAVQSNAGLSRQAAIEASEWSLSSLVGFGKAYFETPEEQRTFENLLQAATDEIVHNTAAGFQGRAQAGNLLRPTEMNESRVSSNDNPNRPDQAGQTSDTNQSPRTNGPLEQLATAGRDAPASEMDSTPRPSLSQLNNVDTDRVVPNGDINSVLFGASTDAPEPGTSGRNRVFPENGPGDFLESTTHHDEAELVGVGAPNMNDPLAMAADQNTGESSTTIDTTANRDGGADDILVNNEGRAADASSGPDGDSSKSDPQNTTSTGNQRSLSDDDLMDRVDKFESNTPLSVDEHMEMLRNLEQAGMKEDVLETLSPEQVSQLEASTAAASLLPNAKPEMRDKLADAMRRLDAQSDLTIESMSKLFEQKAPAAKKVQRLMIAADMIEAGIHVDIKDLQGSHQAEARMKKAQEQLTQGVDLEKINRQLSSRRYVDTKIDKLGLSKDQKYELEISLERLIQNDQFSSKHSMEDVFAFIKQEDPRTKPQINARQHITQESLNAIENIALLSQKNIDGVDRLFDNIKKISSGAETGDIRGFYKEAEVALQLIDQGYKIEHLSADRYNNESFSVRGESKPREIDIIARKPDGSLKFIEVKSTAETFLKKNSGDITRSQVAVQSGLAAKFGAENEVIIASGHDLDSKRSGEKYTQRKRIDALLNAGYSRGLLPNPPKIFEANGRQIF